MPLWSVGAQMHCPSPLESGLGQQRPRLQAVIATAAMDEAQLSAWCREQGVYPTELQQWKSDATAALTESTEERVSPQQAREDKKRIKELERDLRRKDKALAEAAALLVLSKQMEAIFRRGEDE